MRKWDARQKLSDIIKIHYQRGKACEFHLSEVYHLHKGRQYKELQFRSHKDVDSDPNFHKVGDLSEPWTPPLLHADSNKCCRTFLRVK